MLRMLPGEAHHVLPQQMVDCSRQRSHHGVVESVWPGIHGAPRASRVSFHGTSTIRWQGRWSVFLGHKGPQSPRVQMAWIHGAPLLVHGSGWGSFLRGLLCAGPIDGRLFQGTESPWSRGVIVAWHPWCTSCWRVAQDGAVNHESSTTWWEGRWSILPPNGGHVESLIRRAMATAVHFMLVGGSGRGSCHGRPTTCRKEDGRFL
ncbi:uncharacterized protein LOC108293711 isoform X14 [Cebus imitator]|uniref:uncharacterized protein LOC108293711 isoform X14 n=1 Tax=Cebus imitator TaxID=2715852 RepID=UPI00189856B6|nr:uncharacterized protein LOC108293711 isoform X14 [Cebus imitator]